MNEEFSAPHSDAHSSPRDADSTTEPPQSDENHSDAVAPHRAADTTPQSKNELEEQRDAEPRSRDADVFGDPFADLSDYALTVGEAIDRFIELGRVAPKHRTMQEYCKEGKVDCYKLQTTREGSPRSNHSEVCSSEQTRPNACEKSYPRVVGSRRSSRNHAPHGSWFFVTEPRARPRPFRALAPKGTGSNVVDSSESL